MKKTAVYSYIARSVIYTFLLFGLLFSVSCLSQSGTETGTSCDGSGEKGFCSGEGEALGESPENNSDEIEDDAEGESATGFEVIKLFSADWSIPKAPIGASDNVTELGGLAFDPVTDNLFFIKNRHNHSDNEIYRYNFSSNDISLVYSFPSQWDYGLRVFAGELYVAQSYDNAILKLTDLAANRLSRAATYAAPLGSCALCDVNDMVLVDDRLFFVLGHMLMRDKHSGIQFFQSSVFGTVHEFLSSAASGWPSMTSSGARGFYRSIVSVGSGRNTKLAVHTGSGVGVDTIELYYASGKFIRSEFGYKEAALQTDSRDRIYTISAEGSYKITRWSEELTDREEFVLDFKNDDPDSLGIRFILRETETHVEVVFAHFRDRGNPIFYKTIIPNEPVE